MLNLIFSFMQFDVLTLFPKIIESYCSESILGRARKARLIKVGAHNFREYTKDNHGHVDARPYGGGPGMVLQIQPIYDCLKKIKALQKKNSDSNNGKIKIIALDPKGKKFDQRMAEKFSKCGRLVFICGRYEGFDERIYKLVDERISVGDYILSGGELPALTVIEAVSRLIPGVLGNAESLMNETFGKSKVSNLKSQINSKLPKSEIFKEYPQYTRPENFMGLKVPKALLSGNHKLIEKWRESKSKKTGERRKK